MKECGSHKNLSSNSICTHLLDFDKSAFKKESVRLKIQQNLWTVIFARPINRRPMNIIGHLTNTLLERYLMCSQIFHRFFRCRCSKRTGAPNSTVERWIIFSIKSSLQTCAFAVRLRHWPNYVNFHVCVCGDLENTRFRVSFKLPRLGDARCSRIQFHSSSVDLATGGRF